MSVDVFASPPAEVEVGLAYEYGLRCAFEGHRDFGQIFLTGDEQRLRDYVANTPACYELVRRAIGPWEAVS